MTPNRLNVKVKTTSGEELVRVYLEVKGSNFFQSRVIESKK